MKKKKTKINKPYAPRTKARQSAEQTITGTLDVAKHGMGYVMVPDLEQDIIVRRENLKNAMQGDTVEVSVFKQSTGGRMEGVVTRVVKRAQNELIGTVQKSAFYAFVVPDSKSFTRDIFLSEANSAKLNTGDRVIVRIIDWNEKLKNPEGIVIDTLNDERVNEVAMKEILLQAGFSLDFPEEVLKESEALSVEIPAEEIARRTDLRDVLTLTIDPHDAKDFDDAISIRDLNNGWLEIGVHIADVGHYVTPGSALDTEAYRRATSVYLPDRVLPMLPEHISNGLCSLRPLEDKLTFSVLFHIKPNGQVGEHRFAKTVIHSRRRFTYEEVQTIIEGGADPLRDTVMTLHQISQALRKEKFKAGAINFSSEESRFILDEHGVPTGIEMKENNESHQLIEELMLLANRTVAAHIATLTVKGEPVPFPYRIHDTPDPDKLRTFARFAAGFGHKFNMSTPQDISRSFNRMIERTGARPEDSILHTLGIRTMAKAVYSTNNIGHYGLAFEFYCHFTSPIRRYPDVLVHRILLESMEKMIKPQSDMEERCRHCSERERKAMEAEREANKYKQVEFMRQYLGEEFDAVVSGVAQFGFWAQTTAHRCEGFISVHHLQDLDEFRFMEKEYALLGRSTGIRFQIGKPVRIRVAAASLEKRQIDFDLMSDEKSLR